MQFSEKTLKTLEFDKIRQLLAESALQRAVAVLRLH